MPGKKYLVTGGTGFIGSALVHSLLKDGHTVRTLDNNLRGTPERLKDIADQIEMIEADVRDARRVADALKGMDAVCHLAYVNGTQFFYERPELVLDIAVRGMINVIDGCIDAGVKELILASSSEAYQTPPSIPTDESVPLCVPDPLNPRYSYGGGKIISELMALNYGRQFFERVLIFRPHNVYGPDMGWEHVIPQFAVRMHGLCMSSSDPLIRFPIQGTGRETRSFVYIDDFTAGLRIVMDRGEHRGIYHIGTMNEFTMREVAEEVARCFGREIEVVPGELAEGGTLRRCPDTARITKLGYDPKMTFPQGVRKTVDWYIRNIDKVPDHGLKG